MATTNLATISIRSISICEVIDISGADTAGFRTKPTKMDVGFEIGKMRSNVVLRYIHPLKEEEIIKAIEEFLS